METESPHVGRMEKQLKKWDAQLDELVTKADAAGTEVEAGYRKRIDDLRAKYQLVQSKLEGYKASGGDKWEHFEAGIESAWNEIRDAFKELTK